jgi:glutamate racemase
VIATEATVRSGAYFTAIKDQNPAVQVEARAASALVPLIEAGDLSSPQLVEAVRSTLATFKELPAAAKIDTLLLGCTHFPLIRNLIAAELGESIAVVDSAAAAAAMLQEVISVNHLDAPGSTRGTAADPGAAGHSAPARAEVLPVHHLFTTGAVAGFSSLADRLFGDRVMEAEQISLSR